MGIFGFLKRERPRPVRDIAALPSRKRGGRLNPDERMSRARVRQKEAEARTAQTWAREQQRYLRELRVTDPNRYQAVMEARLGIGSASGTGDSLIDSVRAVKSLKREMAGIFEGGDEEGDEAPTAPIIVPDAPPMLSAILNSGVGIEVARGLRAYLEAGAGQMAAMGVPSVGPATPRVPQALPTPATPQPPRTRNKPAQEAAEGADPVATVLYAVVQVADRPPQEAAQTVVGYALQAQQHGDTRLLGYLHEARSIGAVGLRYLAGLNRRHPQLGEPIATLLDQRGEWLDAFLAALFGLLEQGAYQPAPAPDAPSANGTRAPSPF